MEDPIILGGTTKDASTFESEACEKYLQSFQLNLEDINVPPVEPKEPKLEPDENQTIETRTPSKIQSRRPTLEINGVQVKPKTLAEYREAIKRKSLDEKSAEEIVNDENKSKVKNVRRHTIESPQLNDKKNIKVLGEHCNKKIPKTENNQKSPKVKEEAVNENTVTRSGRVSKKVLKVGKVKEKHKKQEDEDSEGQTEVIHRKVIKQCPSSDHYPNSVLRPDSKVGVDAVDTKVVMYTGAGRHLHSYAIHNYNLLTENTFDVSAWQRDFALTALNNNIDNSGRSIFRSTLPLVSKKLIEIKNDLREGKFDSQASKTESFKDEKLRRSRRRKKRQAVWTKPKTHSLPVQNAKKIKDEGKDVSLDSENNESIDAGSSTDRDESIESSPQLSDEVKTLKRKLNPNEEDDLYWEMYGTSHKRVKLKLIQTQSDSNKKPQWTSVNYEKENRLEETEKEMKDSVSTVLDSMVNYVELNNDYNEKDVTMDPTYLEEYKIENEDSDETPKQLKRKRNNSSRVKWELKRLDVLIFEHETDSNKNGDGTCTNDFCKLGCICESISVRPKNIAINHCSEINCIFKCVCPAPKRNEQKPPIRDESEIIRSVAEKRNGRNLAKKEKEWIQTLVKTNDEYIIMQSKGNKNKREVKKPERYREESLHWENVAHQKFLYEKVKRSLREKAKKVTKDDSSPATGEDSNESTCNNESSTVSLKDKKRAEMKLLKRLRKRKRLQEMKQEEEEKKQEADENKPNKSSPFKFYFCKEHSVLDCKCKAKKESKEETNTTNENTSESKLKTIEKEINTLSSNLGNLSSKEKDKLLSLMREQQTLQESTQQQSNEKVVENKEDLSNPATGTDEEYIDLNTLCKFIKNPDEVDNVKDTGENVKDSLGNSDNTKGNSSQSQPAEDVEIIEDTPPAIDDCMPKIQIKSVRSLQPEEFAKLSNEDDDDIELLEESSTPASSQQQDTNVSIHTQPSLQSIQTLVSEHDTKKTSNATIDFYGFMLHNGIGYLPISQYSPNQLYLIFKNPTKKDPLPIIFHGADYLQKASTWANSFLNGYVKFHPKNQNPCWKIIKFSSTRELKNWKLFDFKFLKDYAPIVLTEEGIYKVKGKILYKLLLLPTEKVFKFKQVMEAKLDMDDMSFIEKYEFFHNRRENLPKKPIRFIQKVQVMNDDVKEVHNSLGKKDPPEGPPPEDVGLEVACAPTPLGEPSPSPSPPTQGKGIFIKPTESLLQHHVRAKTVNIPSHIPISPSQHLHRKNIMNNLNRLATARMKNSRPAPAVLEVPSNVVVTPDGGFMTFTHTGVSPHTNSPAVPVAKTAVSTVPATPTNSVTAKTLVPILPAPPNMSAAVANSLLGSTRRPRVSIVGDKPPPPYPLGMAALNQSIVRLDNFEKYRQFIQISDLVQNQHEPPSIMNKSHPILSKSLKAPTPEAAVCIEKVAADAGESDNDIESNLDTFKISKMKKSEDTKSNNTIAVNNIVIINNNMMGSNNNMMGSNNNMVGSNNNMMGSNNNIMGSNNITENRILGNNRTASNPLKYIRKNPSTLSTDNISPVSSSSTISSPTNPLVTTSSMDTKSKASSSPEMPATSSSSNPLSTTKGPLTMASMNLMLMAPPTPVPVVNAPKKPPPGLKPLKPLPGLTPMNPGNPVHLNPTSTMRPAHSMNLSPVNSNSMNLSTVNSNSMNLITVNSNSMKLSAANFPRAVTPPHLSKRLTEEVDISMSPVKNRSKSSSEPGCLVEEIPWKSQSAEVSIVDCISRMDNRFSPITFTPNGEDTVTISPIVVNDNVNNNTSRGVRPQKMGGSTVFERLSAVKRLNDGEPLEVIARSMNVAPGIIADWSRKFEKLQKQQSSRNQARMLPGYPFGTPES